MTLVLVDVVPDGLGSTSCGCHRWIPRVDLVSVAARQKLFEPFYRLLGSMRGDVGMGPLGFMRALIRFVVTCTFVWRRDLGEDEPS